MEILFLITLAAGLALAFGPAWALTANTQRNRFADQEIRQHAVAAGVRIYKGANVGADPAGYAKPFVPGDLFLGIAYGEADNTSGAAGAISVPVQTTGDWELPLAGVALADVGKPVYATDDGAYALTGHPDAYVGRIVHYFASGKAVVRMRGPGETAPNGAGSVTLRLTGHETFTATGATAGTAPVGAFDLKSILGPGFAVRDAEDGGIVLAFDATAEVALASVRTPHDILPVDKGLTAEFDLVVSDKGDAAAIDFDVGFGTALTANSEANIDHADMVNLFAVHLDGNSDNILLQSDDNVIDVPPADTGVDNDSTTDVPKKFKLIIRPTGACECWINGVRQLPSTAFAVASAANLAFFANAEKTSDDTTFEAILRNLVIKAGCAA